MYGLQIIENIPIEQRTGNMFVVARDSVGFTAGNTWRIREEGGNVEIISNVGSVTRNCMCGFPFYFPFIYKLVVVQSNPRLCMGKFAQKVFQWKSYVSRMPKTAINFTKLVKVI